MGDLKINCFTLYKFCEKMLFLPENLPKFNEKMMKQKNLFIMKDFDKKFKQYEILLQKMWNILSQKSQKKVDVQKLTLFVLNIYNLKLEQE